MKKLLDRCVDFFTAMLVLGMTVVVFISVFYRYVLNHPLSWTEEVTRLMIVWLSFVGAYVAMREKKHIGFDLFVAKMPKNARRTVFALGQILIAVFLFVVVWEGSIFAGEFLDVTMPYTNIPIGWFAYSVFPISGALMLMQTVIDFADSFKNREQA